MAISFPHWSILLGMKNAGLLPQGGSILEIGQANLYGDFDPMIMAQLLDEHGICELAEKTARQDWFALAELAYRGLFAPTEIVAIDLGGESSLKLNLNREIRLDRQFDVCLNHGTAEHIFDIANVFRTMHANTKAGGLLIHEAPFTGWVDHGFYCLQPTLFWDVALANGYQILTFAVEDLAAKRFRLFSTREQVLEAAKGRGIPPNLMLFVALRKMTEADFVVPIQGVYAGTAGKAAEAAWQELR